MKWKFEPFMKLKYAKSYWRMFLLGVGIFLVFLAVAAFFALVYPRMTAQNSPERTLQAFARHLEKQDLDAAAQLEYEIYKAGAVLPETAGYQELYEALFAVGTQDQNWDGIFTPSMHIVSLEEQERGTYAYEDPLSGEVCTAEVTYVRFDLAYSETLHACTLEGIPMIEVDGKWYILCPPMAQLCAD